MYSQFNISYNPLFRHRLIMKKWEKIPDEMNDFKIIKDLGLADNGVRYGIVICKACQNEFETSLYHLNIINSCGCVKYSQIKPLPDVINGFKIIKDLGSIKIGKQSKRRVIAECKACQRHYECTPTYLKDRKHCGCRKKGAIVSKYAKSHPRLNSIYKGMIARCYRKTHQDYHLYGGRNISVCGSWLKDRNIFCEWALKNGYQDNLTIDRIDSNKGYFPENCRWADAKIQARNTRRNVLTMELAEQMRKDSKNSIGKGITELAKKYKISQATVVNVLNYASWTDD